MKELIRIIWRKADRGKFAWWLRAVGLMLVFMLGYILRAILSRVIGKN